MSTKLLFLAALVMNYSYSLSDNKVIIVGGGLAGMFVSILCKINGFDPYLIDGNEELGGDWYINYKKSQIKNLPGIVSISGEDFIKSVIKQMLHYDVKYKLSNTVLNIQKTDTGFLVETRDGNFECKQVILATGAGKMSRVKPTLSNRDILEKAGYIQYQINDLAVFRNKSVLVGGGGDSAVSFANSIVNIASSVILIARSKIKSKLAINNTIILVEDTINAINIFNKQIQVNCTNKSLVTDFFIPFYGFKTVKNDFLTELVDFDDNNRIIVDPGNSMTKTNGLYCIGVASTYKNRSSNNLVTAFGQADSVIANMKNRQY